MAYKITEECVGCGSCVEECPNNAIKEENSKYIILGDICVECGNCIDVCPVDAIVVEEE